MNDRRTVSTPLHVRVHKGGKIGGHVAHVGAPLRAQGPGHDSEGTRGGTRAVIYARAGLHTRRDTQRARSVVPLAAATVSSRLVSGCSPLAPR